MYKSTTAEPVDRMQAIRDFIIKSIFQHIPEQTTVTRKSKVGNVLAVSPEIQQQKYDITKYLRFKQYDDIVFEFYQALEDNFSECDLTAFYRNIKDLTITNKKRTLSEVLEGIIKGIIPTAEYHESLNTIYLIDNKSPSLKGIITHELLHMATTKKSKDVIFCGFYQYYKNKATGIGYALNEGYTEYLNRKYLQNDDLDEAYTSEQLIAQGIENIVGSKKMEQLYFAADLRGVINELAKYTSIDNAMNLIRTFDKIQRKAIAEDEKEDAYRTLREQVAAIYLEKQKQLLERGEISEQEYADRKIMYADIYINEKVAFAEGATLYREDCVLKVIDNNRGVAVITNTQKYRHKYGQVSTDPNITELVMGSYSYHDDYQTAVEAEHKRRG